MDLDPVRIEETRSWLSKAQVFRYPGEFDTPTLDEEQENLDIARSVCDEIISRLPEQITRLTSQ